MVSCVDIYIEDVSGRQYSSHIILTEVEVASIIQRGKAKRRGRDDNSKDRCRCRGRMCGAV